MTKLEELLTNSLTALVEQSENQTQLIAAMDTAVGDAPANGVDVLHAQVSVAAGGLWTLARGPKRKPARSMAPGCPGGSPHRQGWRLGERCGALRWLITDDGGRHRNGRDRECS